MNIKITIIKGSRKLVLSVLYQSNLVMAMGRSRVSPSIA